MKTRLLILLLAISILWISSCKEKTSEINYNPNVLSAKDYVRAEDAMMELLTAFFKGIHDTLVINHGYGLIDYCSVTRLPGDTAMTFGYGEVNRMCMDGKRRRGLFMAAFDGPVFEDGVTANIVTDSLFVDDSLVEARMEIRNLGLNASDLPEFSMKVSSSAISSLDTNKLNKIRIIADFTFVWSAGFLTPEIHEDDTLIFTGVASGTSADLYSFSVIIQEPLKNYIDCYWIMNGISQITVPAGEYPSGEIDYISDDGCFNEIHFYFNGNLFYDFLK